MSNFPLMYPHCAALKLPIVDAGPGFDELDVEQKLGPDRFAKLMKGVKRVFCCGHAKYGEDCVKLDPSNPQPATTHRIAGYERHCIYAEDLEAFLAQGG